MRIVICSLALLALVSLVACASYPPPTERMTTTEAAIRGAREVGADQIPRAALHMKLAQEQADKARQLMQDGYNDRADLTLKRAQADAELAIGIAREAQMTQKAHDAEMNLQKVKSEAMQHPGAR
jgi:hypothetical protein